MVNVDRRKSQRRLPKQRLELNYRKIRKFPFPKGEYLRFGPVLDISVGGLAVEYHSHDMKPVEMVEYSLSVIGRRLDIEGIKMSAISDFIFKGYSGCGEEVCRRRSYRFLSMRPEQKKTLLDIIRTYTVPPPS